MSSLAPCLAGFAPAAAPAPGSARAADVALMARVARGDRAAFEVVHARLRRPILSYLQRLIGDAGRAEEVLSELMLALWRQASVFAGRSSLETWAFGIAHNKAASLLRKRRDEPLDEGVAETIGDDRPNPEDEAGHEQLRTLLGALIAKLSAPQRAILRMAYFEGLSIEETAERLAVSPNTVKTRLFCARRHLRRMLAERGITSFPA